MNPGIFVQLVNVTKTYHPGERSVVALDRVSLEIGRGEVVAVTGKSGCGKSTLINMIAGLDSPDEGQVLVNGEDITRMDDRRLTLFRRDRIGIIFQFFNLLPILTLEENITLPYLLRGNSGPPDPRIDGLLYQTGLLERKKHLPHQLSGGEMQRVAICRALINDPEIILADEPTGNLDSASGKEILGILRKLRDEQGKTVLLVTHSQDGEAIADRVLTMRDGRISS
jgi:putative ABC transport system ATP-binding protein